MVGNLTTLVPKRGNELFTYLKNYFQESRQEATKVTWPERKYVMAATALVLLIVFVITLLVMGIDYLYSKIFGWIFNIANT